MKKLILSLIAGLAVTSALASEPTRGTTLEFRLVVDSATTNSEPMTIEYAGRAPELVNVEKTNVLDQHAVRSAVVNSDQLGNPGIEITLTESGRRTFGEFTKSHIGRRLVLVINGRGRSAPIIQTPIEGGKILIHGNFTPVEAKDLVAGINGPVK